MFIIFPSQVRDKSQSSAGKGGGEEAVGMVRGPSQGPCLVHSNLPGRDKKARLREWPQCKPQ